MKMNDILPELLSQICDFLHCKYIVTLSLSSNHFNKIINDNNLINNKKYEGYPRTTNHCKSYDITKYGKINNNKLLDLLINDNIDLIRGDIIYNEIDHTKTIFDGCKIIDFDCIIGLIVECIPAEFIIGVNDISISYWEPTYSRYDDVTSEDSGGVEIDTVGIEDLKIILTITDDLRKQLLHNIEYNGMEEFRCYKTIHINYINFYSTKFTINNINYYIVRVYNRAYDDSLKHFLDCLSFADILVLDYYPDTAIGVNYVDFDSNILFLKNLI